MGFQAKMINNNLVRWIVGIVVVTNIIFLLYTSYGLFDSINSINELTKPYTIYDEQRESIERLLVDNNYEVLNVYMSNYSAKAPFFEQYDIEDNTICNDLDEGICYSDKVGVSVEMKSLGNRDDQIWDALISMSVIYENAFTYRIEIKSPTDTCNYLIFGDIYRDYTNDYNSKSRELLQSQIDEYTECS